jgi:hypothetical protein
MTAQVTGDGQEGKWSRGAPSIVSRGPSATVAVAPQVDDAGTHKVGDTLMLLVGVENHGDAPVALREADVSVFRDGERMKVWTVQELAAAIRKRAASARSTAVLNGALGPHASGSIEDMGKTARTSVGSAPDPTPGAGTLNAIDGREAAALDALRILLKPTTVAPGGRVAGWVRIDVPDSRRGRSRYEVSVAIGDEVHGFTLDESPVE